MTVYCGVDFHARQQTVCFCDSAGGEARLAELRHDRADIRGFYSRFTGEVVVGIEAGGYNSWFVEQSATGWQHFLLRRGGERLRIRSVLISADGERQPAVIGAQHLLKEAFCGGNVTCGAEHEFARLAGGVDGAA